MTASARTTQRPSTAILHYTAPPVVGGVEAVIEAHAGVFVKAGFPVTVVAGWGKKEALPTGTGFVRIPEIDSRHQDVVTVGAELEQGRVPPDFEDLVNRLVDSLAAHLQEFDNLIVHNIFTKHFNLPLTAALYRLLDADKIGHCIAWCHDFTWTSPSSRSKVRPGYPWDLLREQRSDTTYVAVSQRRQQTLAQLYGCAVEDIRLVYNGVDPRDLLGLSAEGYALIDRLGLFESDLILLMPVRVTQAKNIEFALRTMAAIKARHCQAKLILTGPPDPHDADSMAYFQSLQSLRQELDLEEEMRFVFESGLDPEQPLTIHSRVVGDLFRVSDVMFMPSHREGFGMPVLEAGLVGIPVVSTAVPAAEEIGGADIIRFDAEETPDQVARRILEWAAQAPQHRLRRRTRKNYTWRAIFERDIQPLLRGGDSR